MFFYNSQFSQEEVKMFTWMSGKVVGLKSKKKKQYLRVSVQGVKSLGGHFACLCRGLNFMK